MSLLARAAFWSLAAKSARFYSARVTLLRPDTIFALASQISPKGSPVAVVRVSGPNVPEVAKTLTRKKLLPNPRTAALCNFYDPQDAYNELIDQGVLLWFPSPNSYTGEDVIELMLHGSHAVVSKMIKVLGTFPHLRPAEAGEFTKRSFLNGKMDLVSAEAVNDLISSRNEAQRKRALSAVSGQTSHLYHQWRQSLLHLIANVEANIDFGEDQLLEESVESCIEQTVTLSYQIAEYIKEQSRSKDLSANGFNIAIVGEPNAGKSSLMNLLCKRDVSIVSPVLGTTRDIVQVTMEMNGYFVTFNDTAGIRECDINDPQGLLESEGVRRAIDKAKSADLILALYDASNAATMPKSIADTLQANSNVRAIVVANKSDLLSPQSVDTLGDNCLVISCLTGQGLEKLEETVAAALKQMIPQVDDCFVNERHLIHLEHVLSALQASRDTFKSDLAIAARHLLSAVDSLAAITHRITNEDILDEIFTRFCIGK